MIPGVGFKPGEGVSNGDSLTTDCVGWDGCKVACSCGTSVGVVTINVGAVLGEDTVAPGEEAGEAEQATKAMSKELVMKALKVRMDALTAR